MRVCVLGSSSGGNSTFVSDGGTRVLIDTGNLPVRAYIQPMLAAIGEDWNDLDAILVSHDHGDHLNSNTFSIAWRTQTPVYVPGPVAERLAKGEARPRRSWVWSSVGDSWWSAAAEWPFLGRCREAGLVRPLDEAASLGGLEVASFSLPHDSEPTLGFVLTGRGGVRVGVATDLGHCPEAVVRHLRDCDALVFEACHDVKMVRESGRPESLIERNLGPWGHLSNVESAAALSEIIGGSRRRPQCVLLAHISQECNRPDLACETVSRVLRRQHLRNVAVQPTYARARSAVVDLRQ